MSDVQSATCPPPARGAPIASRVRRWRSSGSAKVTTAVITTAMLVGPLGFVVAGPLIESWGPRPVFLLLTAGQPLATLPFLAVAFRSGEPVGAPA